MGVVIAVTSKTTPTVFTLPVKTGVPQTWFLGTQQCVRLKLQTP